MVATAEAKAASDTKSSRSRPRKGTSAKPKKHTMSDEHKVLIAEGREQARKVNRYLEALIEHRPKRGRRVTVENLQERLERVEAELATATGTDRLNLLQQKRDLRDRMEVKEPEVDMSALEAEFAEVAKVYGERKKIARSTWIEFGVPPAVLKAAGI